MSASQQRQTWTLGAMTVLLAVALPLLVEAVIETIQTAFALF